MGACCIYTDQSINLGQLVLVTFVIVDAVMPVDAAAVDCWVREAGRPRSKGE